MVIDHSFIHTTADGRDLLVVHGDLFDRSCTRFMPVAWVGAWLHEFVTILNARVNRTRARRERGPINFAAFMKLAIKRILKRASSFENELIDHAVANGCDGVICGHVHRPIVHEREDGRIYVNTGDWVEHCTAVVEDLDGRLKLIEWEPVAPVSIPRSAAEGAARSPALLHR